MKSGSRFSAPVIESMRRQLDQFGTESPGVQLAVLSSADGFPLAAVQVPGSEKTAPRLAAMTSSIAALGDAITRETGLERSHNIIIESDNGTVVLITIRELKPAVALAIVASKQAILGHLLWAARNTAAAIARLASP